MVFFITDPHFGHSNIIKMCNRPFCDVEEMNERMIKTWNEKVHGNDTVYIVGDMFFRCADEEQVLKRLKGNKRLIKGNHDRSWIKSPDILKYFLSVDDYLETSDGRHSLVFCHYPLLSWNRPHKSYMVFGHIHNNVNSDYFPLICAREHMLNAGAEINGYEPVTFDELVLNNSRFKEKYLTETSF